MITYNNLYEKVCSLKNLHLAFIKARKGKSKKKYVIDFQEDLMNNLNKLREELINKTYTPNKLKRFIIKDPKTRTIHASIFRDRIVHHAIINILEPIYQPIFIYDSFASQKDKGSHLAVNRFESFVKKVSNNGRLIKNSLNNNQIRGYVLKADFRHYFDTVNHEVLIKILEKKIDDKDLIWLIRVILENFDDKEKGIGMPLGNYTSQFFANVYLNELDYYIKHILKLKYYIRYVDDFVILHKDKKVLEYYLSHIKNFLPCLKIKLHPDKTDILPLRNGITFLGYRILYHYKLITRRNKRHFIKKLDKNIEMYKEGVISKERLESRLNGWLGYAKFSNTYNFRKNIINKINDNIEEKISISP